MSDNKKETERILRLLDEVDEEEEGEQDSVEIEDLEDCDDTDEDPDYIPDEEEIVTDLQSNIINMSSVNSYVIHTHNRQRNKLQPLNRLQYMLQLSDRSFINSFRLYQHHNR